jgi:hypothetical protein
VPCQVASPRMGDRHDAPFAVETICRQCLQSLGSRSHHGPSNEYLVLPCQIAKLGRKGAERSETVSHRLERSGKTLQLPYTRAAQVAESADLRSSRPASAKTVPVSCGR